MDATSGIAGCDRFLQRLWALTGGLADGRRARDAVAGHSGRPERGRAALARKAHWAIDKVDRDSAERFHFNTAVAAAMELLNEVAAAARRRRARGRRLRDLRR